MYVISPWISTGTMFNKNSNTYIFKHMQKAWSYLSQISLVSLGKNKRKNNFIYLDKWMIITCCISVSYNLQKLSQMLGLKQYENMDAYLYN